MKPPPKSGPKSKGHPYGRKGKHKPKPYEFLTAKRSPKR